ncbi:MAG: CocE/NonD family hydrolase [Candidatus Latescibacterota bacterium]|nr:CocE/NonD family hydrolase [Candidatus Latescibacterota bacterium]
MSTARSPEALHDVIVERDVMVTMRDGVRLATDIFFPATGQERIPGTHAAVFHRTPYRKEDTEESVGFCRFFAQRGYIAVIQDCRGTFSSEGDVNFLIPEAEDGFDTLAWIDQQPWSNGKVGSWGTSWSSWTQTAMAALGPANLASMVPNMSGANAHESSVRHGGALELRFLAWAFWHSATNTQAALKADPAIDAALNLGATSFPDWITRMPLRKGQTQLKLVPAYEDWAFRIFTEADFTDYWKHPSFAPALYWDEFPDIPIWIVGGWYDSYTRATLQNYEGLSSRKRGPVRVLVGPWTHGSATVEDSHAGDVDFGEEAALKSFRDLHLKWFDWTLKGAESSLADDAPVRIFVMGGGDGHRTVSGRLFHGGRWREEWEWPLARTAFTPYYLHGEGHLSTEPPTEEGSTTYRFDPADPVPSIGGNVSSLSALDSLPAGIADPAYAPRASRSHNVMSPGGFDQVEHPDFYGCQPPYLPLGSRRDILVYETPVLAADMEITGPIEVVLWVSSSAPDTDFTAKLIDVYPPSPWYPHGYALNLTDSILRLRYRHGPDMAESLPPGEIAQIVIILYPTSNLFSAGHRLRLDISSSNFPRFDVNPNTGDPIGTERRRQGADNTVYCGAKYASHIVLPVIDHLKQELAEAPGDESARRQRLQSRRVT